MKPLTSPAPPRPRPTADPPADATHPESLVALLAARTLAAGDRPALADPLAAAAGTGPPQWSWREVAAAAVEVAIALEAAGLSRGERLAHVAPHSPDWIVVDLACLLGGFVHTAIHDDLPSRERRRLIDWLAADLVVVGGPRRGLPPRAVHVHDLGGLSTAHLAGGQTPRWRELAADPARLEAEFRRRVAACDPDAPATILLSSGTTGRPHGVVQSQRALAWNASASTEMFLEDPRDVRLAWLPQSHAMARVGDLYTALVRGSCLSVVGDRARLLEACRVLPPTVILGVPAFFERLEMATAAGRIGDLPAALGGRVRACVSGGAALRQRTAAFFTARGLPLVAGYGLAEAGPVVAVSNPRIARPGTVGPPLPGVAVRIDDRPATRGQLLVQTPGLALGVLVPPPTDPEHATPAELQPPATHDGWLETGDAAEIDEAGHLRVTGRLRDTLVLATGVKLPPAEVEAALAEDDAVAQVCVVGDGLPWPVALVVPAPEVLRAAMRRMRVRVATRRGAVTHPRVLAWLTRRLARRQRHLPRAWQTRRVVLLDRPFTANRGETTTSLKLRRQTIAATWRDRIEAAAAPPVALKPPSIGVSSSEPIASVAAGPPPAWLTDAVWHAADGGFATAAAAAAAPLGDGVAAIVARSLEEIDLLRAESRLYEPPETPAVLPAAPLADAPPARQGRFSAAAEVALGDVGLWGLAVPERHGGAGGSILDLARAVTTLAAACPTAAGLLAVHSTIGAVSALAAFGTPAQQDSCLPGLAAGRPLSVFGGTEPEVGCDLAAVQAALRRGTDGGLRLTGTKMFITGATYGRLVKLLVTLDGRPTVAVVRLPESDTETFRLRTYQLHPLRHAHNAALEFRDFPVPQEALLVPPAGRDGMAIIWHGLNRGRVTLAAQAAGTLRLLAAQARDHALRRSTWGQPIASRELVQGRLGRIAAATVACEAMTAWAAAAIDAGGTGELEAIAAKTTASACVRAAALDALGVHGGRAFLVGHPLGDSLHDHLAVSIYEGESDLLELAAFKGLCKRHPAMGRGGSAARRFGDWLAWRIGCTAKPAGTETAFILDAELRDHVQHARRGLARTAVEIDRAVRRHGRALAERQLEVGSLAARVHTLLSVLAVAHYADARADATGGSAAGDGATGDGAATIAAADAWCRLALRRAAGRHPTPADFAAVAAVGRRVLGQG